MTKSTPRVLSLLIALLAAGSLLVAGCGGGGGGGGGNDQDAQALLKQAFNSKNANKAKDSDVKVKMQADLQGSSQVNGPLKLEFGGPTKSQGTNKLPQLDWTVKGSALGRNLEAGLVVTSDAAFVKYSGQAYKLDDSTFQQLKSQTESRTNKSSENSFKSLGIDPNDFLTDVKKEDGEPVTGIPTDRVTGTVDTEKAIRTFLKVLKSPAVKSQLQGRTPPSVSDDQINKIKEAVKGIDFSVDIAKTDKTVRRLSAKIEFNVPDAQRSQFGGVKGGTFSFDVEVGKLAPGTQITAPSGAKPIGELSSKLGPLLGGGLGGSGGGTTPGLPQQ